MINLQLNIGVEVKEVYYTPQDGGSGSYYVRVCVNGEDDYFSLYTDGDNGTAESSHYNQMPETYDSLKEVSIENVLYHGSHIIYKNVSNLVESFLDNELQ